MRNVLSRLICCLALGFCAVGCKAQEPDAKVTEPTTREKFIKIAQSQVGTVEDPIGSNRGAQVDAYNLTCGQDYLGAPWCASFTRWCFNQSGEFNVPGAYSPDWYEKGRVVNEGDIRAGDQAIVYFPSLRRFAHTIACIEVIKYRGSKQLEVTTIEGNSNPDGGREGYGVFRRVRNVEGLTFVRWLKE